MKKIELLAPAGDLEKLKIAVLYGADAVYLGGTSFGLRAKAKNFDFEQMREGIEFAHSHGVKVYVTCNVYAHNYDLPELPQYLLKIKELGADAILVADPGVFSVARRVVPEMDIHISTQANNTNYASALFWKELGATRIVMARELPLTEIRQISEKIGDTEIESFVHGAMCISYSGRCLLSNYLTGRDANKGECAHPCRWKYNVTEVNRQGEYMPVVEEENGTYIFNSKDLCMIDHIPELAEAGVYSFKLEGRMKTVYYVGTVVKIYKEAINDYLNDPALYESKKDYYLSEISKASYRGFTTGFYYGKPDENAQVYTTSSYIRTYDFIGMVKGFDLQSRVAEIEQRNKFSVGEEVELLRHNGKNVTFKVEEITDIDGNSIDSVPHAQQRVFIKLPSEAEPFDMLRRRKEDEN